MGPIKFAIYAYNRITGNRKHGFVKARIKLFAPGCHEDIQLYLNLVDIRNFISKHERGMASAIQCRITKRVVSISASDSFTFQIIDKTYINHFNL